MTSEYLYEYTKRQAEYPERFKIGGDELSGDEFNKYIAGIAGGIISYGGGLDIPIQELDNIQLDEDGLNSVIVFGEEPNPKTQSSDILNKSASTVSTDLRKMFRGIKVQKLSKLPRKAKKKGKKKGGDDSGDDSDDGLFSHNALDEYEIAEAVDKFGSEGKDTTTDFDIRDFIE